MHGKISLYIFGSDLTTKQIIMESIFLVISIVSTILFLVPMIYIEIKEDLKRKKQ